MYSFCLAFSQYFAYDMHPNHYLVDYYQSYYFGYLFGCGLFILFVE